MKTKQLTLAEREAILPALTGWKPHRSRDALTKTFTFTDFNEAFGWMTRVALVAEKLGHHPEWCNITNKVEVVLSTHAAGGLTALDIALARAMDAAAA